MSGGKNEMTSIAVCDDDPIFLEKTLKPYLGKAVKEANICADIELFTDSRKLLKCFEEHNPFDIVILDIDMPELDGKELARKLRIMDSCFYLIFVTSYSEEAENASRYETNSFISKTRDETLFISEFKRVFEKYKKYHPQYTVEEVVTSTGIKLFKIPIENILYFELKSKIIYLHICTSDQVFCLNETVFEKVIEKYSKQGFRRSYRSHLVNICKIKDVMQSHIILDNDEKLPLSRRNYKSIMSAVSMLAAFRK